MILIFTTFLILSTQSALVSAAFIPQERLSIFNNYHGLLTYIFNETKLISDAIANQIDDFLIASSYATEEPSESDDLVIDILTQLLDNEPVMPAPPEETYDEISCEEIVGELQALFELSKYFLLKAARNDESIDMLRNVVIELLRSDMRNMEMIASMVDTIADNYRAQNHILTTIREVDKEIEGEMRSVARYCNESRLIEALGEDY